MGREIDCKKGSHKFDVVSRAEAPKTTNDKKNMGVNKERDEMRDEGRKKAGQRQKIG